MPIINPGIKPNRDIKPEEVLYRITIDGQIVPVFPRDYPVSYKISDFLFTNFILPLFNLSSSAVEAWIRNPMLTDDIIVFELLEPSRLKWHEVQRIKEMYPNVEIIVKHGIFALFSKNKATVAEKLIQYVYNARQIVLGLDSGASSLPAELQVTKSILQDENELKRKLIEQKLQREQEQMQKELKEYELAQEFIGETPSAEETTVADEDDNYLEFDLTDPKEAKQFKEELNEMLADIPENKQVTIRLNFADDKYKLVIAYTGKESKATTRKKSPAEFKLHGGTKIKTLMLLKK